MGRFMVELGLSPSARLRLPAGAGDSEIVTRVEFVTVYTDDAGKRVERRMDMDGVPAEGYADALGGTGSSHRRL